jgi:hypothetical protein
MVRGFVVKVKMIPDNVTRGERSAVKFMKPDFPYSILDVHKFRDKDGLFWTWFLVGDQETGELIWVDANKVSFVGVV